MDSAKTTAAAPPAGERVDAGETLPFTALRGRALRAGLLGTGRLATKPGPMAGAVRGVIVAPWFAAATGLVVAAGLWIYSPHAELKFPPSAGGVVRCGRPRALGKDCYAAGLGADRRSYFWPHLLHSRRISEYSFTNVVAGAIGAGLRHSS